MKDKNVEGIVNDIKDCTHVIRNLLRTVTIKFENAALIMARLEGIDRNASLIHEAHLNAVDKVADKLRSVVGEGKG